MKKRMFFGFAFFIMLSMMVAWKFAAAELADLQNDDNSPGDNQKIELVALQNQEPLLD